MLTTMLASNISWKCGYTDIQSDVCSISFITALLEGAEAIVNIYHVIQGPNYSLNPEWDYLTKGKRLVMEYRGKKLSKKSAKQLFKCHHSRENRR